MSNKLGTSNPYDQETPEWQLFALAESAESAALAHAADADRALQKADQQRAKAKSFRDALAKLTAKP